MTPAVPSGLEQLGLAFTVLLMNFAGVVFVAACGWQGFKVLLNGGSQRAVESAVVRIIWMAVALAALLNIVAVATAVKLLGWVIVQVIIQAVTGAVSPMTNP